MKFDLHVHTNYSDGQYTPYRVVELAVERQLKGIAITDHDTVAGIEEALEYSKQYKNFIIIPGIELGCIYEGEDVHILGYFIDCKYKELLETIKLLRLERFKRGKRIISRLQSLNIKINLDEVQELSKEDFIGRVHIARVLVNKNYASSISEAFKKYLNRDAPAYVERKVLSINQTIKLINRSGGVAILAHPGILKEQTSILEHCIESGIQGIECIQSKHSEDDTAFLKDLARKNNLLITGGSDCHGDRVAGDLLLGKYYVSELEIEEIKELI